MKVIINRNSSFGTLDGVIKSNVELNTIINRFLKEGTAKKLVDTEDTLMYELTTGIHPIFGQILNSFGIR
jgi:hypothetical protein